MPQLSSADEVDPEVPLHQYSPIRNPPRGGLPAEATGERTNGPRGPRFASGVLSTTKLAALLHRMIWSGALFAGLAFIAIAVRVSLDHRSADAVMAG